MKEEKMIEKVAIVFLLMLCTPSDGQGSVPEAELWNYLKSSTNYSKLTRPVLDDPNKQMDIIMSFILGRLDSLSEKTQVMTTFGWMAMIWTDELLRWNPAEFNGLWRLVLPADQIWLPEIALRNGVDQGNDLSMDSKVRVTIYPDGTVNWLPGIRWKTSCLVDLTSFPYDTQSCPVTIVNWVYQAALVNFTIQETKVDTNSMEENEEWDLVGTLVVREDIIPMEGFRIPSVTFILDLKRKPGYFEANVVIPSLFITVISALVFYLPAESGEKIGLGITILLSYSVLLLMVSDITPRISSMPYITILIVFSMGLTALSLIGTVFILNVFYHCPESPVPRWVRSAVLNGLARILCMTSMKDSSIVEVSPAADKRPPGQEGNERSMHGYQTKNVSSSAQTVELPPEIAEYFRKLNEKQAADETIERNRREWQRVSRVLDRLFFAIVLLVMSVAGTAFIILIKQRSDSG